LDGTVYREISATEPDKDHISERPLQIMHGNDKSQKTTEQASDSAPPLVGDIYF
jgi:hypothetical protein